MTVPVGSTRRQRRPPRPLQVHRVPREPEGPAALPEPLAAGDVAHRPGRVSRGDLTAVRGEHPRRTADVHLRALPQQCPTHGRDDRTVDRDEPVRPCQLSSACTAPVCPSGLRTPLVRRVTSTP